MCGKVISQFLRGNEMRVVLITGASSGIGREIALAALRDNIHLIVTARRQNLLQDLQQKYPDKIDVIAGDLRLLETRERLLEKVAEYGHLDYLINNAGFAKGRTIEEETTDSLQEIIELNLFALIDLTRLSMPYLKKAKRGRILNIASAFGIVPFPYMASYVATKFGVVGFTKSLNMELFNSSVSATVYCPGKVLTGFENSSFSPLLKSLMEKVADNATMMGQAIWRKRDRRRAVCYPTLLSFMAYFVDIVPDFIYMSVIKLLLKIFSRKTK